MSTQQTKKGRVPASQKSTENSDFQGSQETGLLRVPPAVRKELEENGLASRWISLKEFSANGNFHKNDWIPRKFACLKDGGEFAWGNHPDGYLIRKEMVLAVKPKAMQEEHKARLRRKTDIQSNVVKAGADALRQTLGGSGAKIYEGYEANGGREDGDE